MKRPIRSAILILATVGMLAALGSTAYAFPTKTSPCSGCHGGPNVPVVATLASTTGSTATYNVSAPGATAIAVFSGSTKMAVINTSSGQFSVATGKTYSVFAVTGPSTGDGLGSTSVSPVTPPPADTAAPVTTSNAQATYVSSAAIVLSATDAGSGVAHTYYRLDGAAQAEGTAITTSMLGSHSLEFWSVDVAGNIETPHKTVGFSVTTPPPPADTTAPVTTSNAQPTYVSSAAILLSATDAGSGVAHTYYRLDGAAQAEGLSVSTAAVGSHSLEFWSVDVAGNIETPYNTAAFTVTAPTPPPAPADTTAPVTTSDAKATYVSSAAIALSATDAGSGVAHTYYRLDGAAQAEGTAVSTTAVGSHSLEFWSVDVAGNIETPYNTAAFTVTAPTPPTDKTATRLSIRLWTRRHSNIVTVSGELTPGSGTESIQVFVKRPGTSEWMLSSVRQTRVADDSDNSDTSHATGWSYRFATSRKGTYQFQARFAGNDTYAASISRVMSLTVR